MVHGLGGSRWTNYPIANMFLENGYNVISYDQRSSGENTAEYTTYGYFESHDLEDIYNSVTHDNKNIFTSEDSKHVEIFFDYTNEYEVI